MTEMKAVNDGAADVRMSAGEKAKLKNEFSSKDGKQMIEEEVSINYGRTVDSGALLSGDADEELRMKDRLHEKAQNAKEGKMARVTLEDIRPSQRNPKADTDLLIKKDDPKVLRVDRTNSKENGGRRTPRLSVVSPNHQKFDVDLKKKMLEAEKERTEKAKRDGADERARELAEFKGKGNSASSNIIMPIYERDIILECDRETSKPPESLYIGLGWDEDATTKRKHYRRFYPDELENIKDVLHI